MVTGVVGSCSVLMLWQSLLVIKSGSVGSGVEVATGIAVGGGVLERVPCGVGDGVVGAVATSVGVGLEEVGMSEPQPLTKATVAKIATRSRYVRTLPQFLWQFKGNILITVAKVHHAFGVY